MRGVLRLVGVGLPVLALLVGCAQAPDAGGTGAHPSTSAPAAPGSIDAGAGLVGLWKVAAPGEGDRTWVAVSATEIVVERDRRLIYASWLTGEQRIAATVNGWDGAIEDHAVPWLEEADSFALSGDDVELRSPEGAVLATLSPATEAPAPHGALPELVAPPTLAPEEEARFAVPTPPAEPGPALTEAVLTGRWRTGEAAQDGSRPFLSLAADGSYRGSDGCNGIGGRWMLLTGNRLLLTPSASTAMACENMQPVGMWTAGARTASFVDDRLTLYDTAGDVLGSFDRR